MDLPPETTAHKRLSPDPDVDVLGSRTGPKWRAKSGDASPIRREQIIRAARDVLCRKGYAVASLKEIAREAGVAPGLLHYYFDSKQELLIEVVTQLQHTMEVEWDTALASVSEPLERLVAALDRTAMISVEQPGFMRLMFDLYGASQYDDLMRSKIQEIRQRRLEFIGRELRAALGHLPAYAVVPPDQLAHVVGAAIDGIVVSRLVEGRDSLPAYHALKAMLLSVVVTAYVATGQQPPMARLKELLGRPPVRRTESAD